MVILTALGLAGVVWMIVDIVRLGWSEVPGSTYACGVLGAILGVFAVYRDLGGQPLVTANPNWESEAQQFEDQQKHDGFR
ncbi:MAG: hypothetical protein WAW85_16945 [Gordonia sp. (in: high G+C Gram-positive bacteria)]